MIRLRVFPAMFCLLALLTAPAAAQSEPLHAPLSPEQRATLPAELRDDPRAFGGALAFGYVETYGCGAFQLQLRFAYVAPAPDTTTYAQVVVRQSNNVYMNTRHQISSPSGIIEFFLQASQSGGPTNATLPMSATTTTTVSALLMDADNKPLWFTEAFFDCDGSPSPTVNRQSGPVMLLNKNGSFDTAGATDKTAEKWKLTSGASRTCTALPGDCAIKLKGKPDKETSLSQKSKHDLSFTADNMLFGMIVTYDTVGAAGELGYSIVFRFESGPIGLGDIVPLAGDATGKVISFGLDLGLGAAGFDRSIIHVNHGGAAAGKLYIRSVYSWGYVLLD